MHGKGNETKEVTGDNAVEAEIGVIVGRGNGDGRGKGAEAGTEIEGDTVEKETRINLGVEAGRDAEIGVEVEKETRIDLGVEAGRDVEIGVEAESEIDIIVTSRLSQLAN